MEGYDSMRDANGPENTVEEIMLKIRQELERRNTGYASRSGPGGGLRFMGLSKEPDRLTLPPMTNPQAYELKDTYALPDFLAFHDEDFIRYAYQAILKREPDTRGFNHYLEKLRSGAIDKIEILFRLRYSPEGRKARVRVNRLFFRGSIHMVGHIPVIGYVTRMAATILRVPVIMRNLKNVEAYTHFKINDLNKRCEDANRLLTDYANQLSQQLSAKADREEMFQVDSALKKELSGKASVEKTDSLQHQIDEIKSIGGIEELSNRLDALADSKSDLSVAQALQEKVGRLELTKAAKDMVQHELTQISRQMTSHKRHILDQQRRLGILLEEARKRLPEPINSQQIENMLSEEEHLLNAMYVTFEDQFRGTRDNIKQRQRTYIPTIKGANAGTTERPILDLGCGRGEWLELMKANALFARGVDMNRIMVSQCHQLGLDVVEADAITYLRNLESASMGAITGFHIIEHLPLKTLIAWLDESFRVLKPGGVVIFESPNPENLTVGACNFYLDPTHIKPLPPVMTSFLLEARGFSNVEINRLHPCHESLPAHGAMDQDVVDAINQHLYGHRDFAVIGYKLE